MATLASVAKERKTQLKQLSVASRRLDAKQEMLEREVKRLQTRKRSIPELADAERLAGLALAVEGELVNMSAVIAAMAVSWGST